MYQNYVFDLYGTLVDIDTDESNPYLWEKMAFFMCMQGACYAADELETQFRQKITESKLMQIKQGTLFHNISFEEVEAKFEQVIPMLYQEKGVTIDLKQAKDWAVMMRTLSMKRLQLFDGAKETLLQLKENGKNIYLLSNAQRLFTEPEMRMLGIYDLFDAIFYSSDIGVKKPSRHFYHALMDKHNLIPDQTVMVGNDWEADAWGAANYGIDSIYIHTSQSSPITGNLPSNCKQIPTIQQLCKATLQ